MAVSCKRVGCRTPASTTLLIDAGGAKVTLVDVESAPAGVTLCAIHVATVSPPVGWTLADARDANLRLLTVEPGPASPVTRGAEAEAAPAEPTVPDPVAGAADDVGAQEADPTTAPKAPAPPSAEELFPWVHHFSAEDEPKTLNASSPLLSRAFRAAV